MPTLHWIGKDKVINHHREVPYKVLEHGYGFTAEKGKGKQPTGSGNMIIQGDNLEALKSLLPQYEGKVKCIYIDPPYNTGNEGWVYNDNVNDPRIKKWLGEVVGKEGEDLSRHDKWLCMMYPRLVLLHKLLAEDGAIFVSCDHNEQAHLQVMCDEIFGQSYFVSNIAVVNNLKGRSDDKYIATAHESLLIYQKGSFITNGVPVPDEYAKEYKLSDGHGSYRLQGLRKRGAGSRREDRPNMYYPFYYNKGLNRLSLERIDSDDIEIVPKLSDGTDGRWRWGNITAAKRIADLSVELVKGRGEFDVFERDYLDKTSKRTKPKSVWLGSEFSSEAGTLQLKQIFKVKTFQTPKSVNLLEYCLLQASNTDSIILDSFAGSGTTAHAVLNLNKQDSGNRKFILIEMMDYADSITAERVKRVMQGYGEGKNKTEGTGGAFDYYTLGAALFDAQQNLNEAVGVERIREYIWYSETRAALEAPATTSKGKPAKSNPYYLGMHERTAYYFVYEAKALTTLDYELLGTLPTKGERTVIYADNCLLPKKFLEQHGIVFKKIPRDISRF